MMNDNIRIAFAITMYDKFENTKLLTDTIRLFFPNSYISIDCNNSNLTKKDFDNFQISYDNLNIQTILENSKQSIYIVGIRELESWCNLTNDCINNSQSDVIIYTHNDTIILDNSGIIDVIRNFEDSNINFLAQETSLCKKFEKQGVADIFFFARTSFLKKNNIFKRYNELLITSTSIHLYVLNSIRWSVGLSHLKIYGHHNNIIDITNGNNRNLWVGSTWAHCYDKKLKIIHADIAHKSGDLQIYNCVSFFLKKFNVDTEYTNNYIKKHKPKEIIISDKLNSEAFPINKINSSSSQQYYEYIKAFKWIKNNSNIHCNHIVEYNNDGTIKKI